ncbi:MAG TPA: FliM/FliN family flagellar motor switch protein [Gaiellales bacterium]|nr:FliM/FliN family flagellar motor switch protein [Gaiellales bacterium]
MTARDALLRLAEATGEAVAQALETVSQSPVERGGAAVLEGEEAPLGSVTMPAVAATVTYLNGLVGGTAFVMPAPIVRRLAAAMMGVEEEPGDSGELSDLQLSAVGEAMAQVMAQAAAALSAALQEDVATTEPEVGLWASVEDAGDAAQPTPHMTRTTLKMLGEQCTLLHRMPKAFVVRLTSVDNALADGGEARAQGAIPRAAIRSVPVRVWAELGRTRMPVGRAVDLASGAVVDLDRAPDDPVDLYVNGRRFATGRLLLVEDEWAVRVETVLPPEPAPDARS